MYTFEFELHSLYHYSLFKCVKLLINLIIRAKNRSLILSLFRSKILGLGGGVDAEDDASTLFDPLSDSSGGSLRDTSLN